MPSRLITISKRMESIRPKIALSQVLVGPNEPRRVGVCVCLGLFILRKPTDIAKLTNMLATEFPENVWEASATARGSR